MLTELGIRSFQIFDLTENQEVDFKSNKISDKLLVPKYMINTSNRSRTERNRSIKTYAKSQRSCSYQNLRQILQIEQEQREIARSKLMPNKWLQAVKLRIKSATFNINHCLKKIREKLIIQNLCQELLELGISDNDSTSSKLQNFYIKAIKKITN